MKDDRIKTKQEKLYDANFKKNLAERSILAWILKCCVLDFMDEDVSDISKFYIEPKVDVGEVSVDGNIIYGRIQGISNEDSDEEDGVLRFDIRFKAHLPGDQTESIIVNIEAQNEQNPGYPLIARAVYYCCRMISSQKYTEFVGSDYGSIRRVYSIWILPYAKGAMVNQVNSYQIKEEHPYGDYYEDISDYDLLTIIMVYLDQESWRRYRSNLGPLTDRYEMLIDILNTSFDLSLSNKEMGDILRVNYGITLSGNYYDRRDVMCNVSQAILRIGEERGEKLGIELTKQVYHLHLQGVADEEVARLCKISMSKLNEILSPILCKVN